MTRVIETTVYKFAELSETAKESARMRMRESIAQDIDYDSVYEDAKEISKILGIDIEKHRHRNGLAIYWSGFSSQGDGAMFEGSYSYAKKSAKLIREYAPKDKALHTIADRLMAAQKPYFYRLTANVSHRGSNYYHEMSASIDVENSAEIDMPEHDTVSEEIADCLRDFMRWIYKQLEAQHDYELEDAQIDELITANEYEFEEDGTQI